MYDTEARKKAEESFREPQRNAKGESKTIGERLRDCSKERKERVHRES